MLDRSLINLTTANSLIGRAFAMVLEEEYVDSLIKIVVLMDVQGKTPLRFNVLVED
jgi:hypothetical protein